MTIVEAIRTLSRLTEDAIIAQITVECPFCHAVFNVTSPLQTAIYQNHFAHLWDTHKPDGFTPTGQPFQILRRV